MRSSIASIPMRGRRLPGVAFLLITLACLPPTLPAAPSLEAVLQNMDSAADVWQGMRAKVEWVRYISLVDDRRVESGRIAVRATKSGAIQMLLAFQQPSVQYISVRQAKVEIYKPKIKTVEEYDLRKSKEKLENALLLGFGTAGSYLNEHYEIVLEGEEAVAGQPAVKLDLQPRNPRGDLNNQRIEMWISTTHWQPIQQKIYDRNPKDYRLYSYSDVKMNPSFKSNEFKLPLGRGTNRVRPQR